MHAIFFPEANPIGMVLNNFPEERWIFRDFRRVIGVEPYNHNACFFRVLTLMGKGLLPKKCLELRRWMKPISH